MISFDSLNEQFKSGRNWDKEMQLEYVKLKMTELHGLLETMYESVEDDELAAINFASVLLVGAAQITAATNITKDELYEHIELLLEQAKELATDGELDA